MSRPNPDHKDVRMIDGKRVATPEYTAWQNMKNRCQNPNAQDYHYYGGRGITVCKRWQEFAPFLADMGRRPTPLHTLDRKRTAGNYTPGNCRWATRKVQARNRPYARNKSWVLAEKLGIKQSTAMHMISQVQAKDRGNLNFFELSPAREAFIRSHLEAAHGKTV